MAGYFLVLATFTVITHVVVFFGAINFVPLILHGPDSDQVFLPVERDDTYHDNGVLLPFFATTFFTVKPGRAVVLIDAAVT